jgi:hypothetical protein
MSEIPAGGLPRPQKQRGRIVGAEDDREIIGRSISLTYGGHPKLLIVCVLLAKEGEIDAP